MATWPFLLIVAAFSAGAVAGCATRADSLDVAGGSLPPEDSGSFDAGQATVVQGADAASACMPGDVATYQPAAYHSATAAWQGACRADLITGFYDACLGPQATAASCAAFKVDPVAAHCADCIVTADTASHYGPLIDHGSFLSTNVAGCVELTDPSGTCAKAVQALDGCELASCKANCPVQDVASLVNYDRCASQADVTGCASYARLASCLGGEADAGLVGGCLSSVFADFYTAVVPLFCGVPQVDAAVTPFDASVEAGPVGYGADAAVMDADTRPPLQGDGGPNPPQGGHDGGPSGPPGPRDASFE